MSTTGSHRLTGECGMGEGDRERIDRLTATVHHLLADRRPDPIPCHDDPDDEIRQLTEKINLLLETVAESRDAIVSLADGALDVPLPRHNFLAAPFKQLQANLKHLTWQTGQIASGDFSQRVDFMGDFSRSFNSMVESLCEARSQLVSQVQIAEQLAELKTRYLNVMAHDIRTPVGAVIGFSDILLDGELGEEQRGQVEIIRRNSDSLLALINNILDFAKLGKRKMEMETIPFSLPTLGEDLVAMLRPRLQEGVRLILTLDPAIPDRLAGDPNRLRQILINLLGNAAKFTGEGSVALGVEVEAAEDGCHRLRFVVEDTGIGIAEEKLEHIFSPFAQAESSTSSRFGGTGLGLSISRELVRLMGGELEVESRLGRGTTFHFTLSLQEAEEPVVAEGAGPGEDGPGAARSRILVVDDEPDVLTAIAHQLGKWPIRFDLCDTSTKVLDILIRALDENDPYTLVWLDMTMPELDGLELARRIRMDQRLQSLPLVACTSYIGESAHPDFPMFFSVVTTKPVSRGVIRQIVELAGRDDYREEEPVDLTGTRVLVVDDSPISRLLVRRILEKQRVQITEAENGREGVREVSDGDFDIVLMDQMMPGMSGADAIRRIRRRYDGKSLPIFALTADESEEGREELLEAGANGIFGKPMASEQLLEGLQRILREKEVRCSRRRGRICGSPGATWGTSPKGDPTSATSPR